MYVFGGIAIYYGIPYYDLHEGTNDRSKWTADASIVIFIGIAYIELIGSGIFKDT